MWINDWAAIRDEFEDGGYKQSGRGRLRGLAQMEDFLEYKHVRCIRSFTYHSETRNRLFTSPFSIHAKVKNHQIVYCQFMEDTFA